MTKTQNIIYSVLLIFVTLAFLAVGSMKLMGKEMEVEMFSKWGYPLWFMYFIGACEVAGGSRR